MSIAEKLTTIAEKVQKVYEAGKAAGGGGDYDQGYEDGKNSVVLLEKYAKTMRFYSLNDFGTKEVTIEFEKANTLQMMFAIGISGIDGDYFERNTTVEHLTIRSKVPVRSLYQMFYCDNISSDPTLKHITFDFDLDPDYNTVNMNNIFRNMGAVEIIDGKPLNVSTTTSFNGTFNGVGKLKEIRFVENSIKASINFSVCSNLSTETIQSIIDGLADLTGGTAQTLTLHATVGAKLTDEQKAAITAKNWTLVY